MSAIKEHYHDQIEEHCRKRNSVTAERQFHGAIFQRKMERWEIENAIRKLEAQFRKAEKIGNVAGTYEIQDELGIMYNRLMKIQRIKNLK